MVCRIGAHAPCFARGDTDDTPDSFHPGWAATAKFNMPIRVLYTDSALGRYSVKTKELGVKDLSRVHGHMCDGIRIVFYRD
jgi:hypothetical protein